jgi:hypothetical protein
VLIAFVDGLKGFAEADHRGFPAGDGANCIVHLLRHSLDFVSWKDRKPVAAALKDIYRAVDAETGEAALSAFQQSFWGQSWRVVDFNADAYFAKDPLEFQISRVARSIASMIGKPTLTARTIKPSASGKMFLPCRNCTSSAGAAAVLTKAIERPGLPNVTAAAKPIITGAMIAVAVRCNRRISN